MPREYREHLQRNGQKEIIIYIEYYFPDLLGFDDKYFLQWASGKKRVSNITYNYLTF